MENPQARKKTQFQAGQKIQRNNGWLQLTVDQTIAWAEKHNKHILLYFETKHCGPCIQYHNTTFKNPKFQKFISQLASVVVRCDGVEGRKRASRWGVNSYPTFIVLNPKGTEIDRFFGYHKTPEFIKIVSDYIAGKNTTSDLKKRAEANPTDVKLNFQAGRALALRKRGKEAEPFLKQVISLDKENLTGLVPRAMLLLGARVYLDQLHDYKKAKTILTLLAKRFPKCFHGIEALYSLARLHIKLKNHTSAEKVLLEKIKIDPKDPIQYFRFGSFCRRYKILVPHAIKVVTQGVQRHPRAHYLWKLLAQLHFSQHSLEKAVEAMKKAAELKPDQASYESLLRTYRRALHLRRDDK